MKTEYSWNPSNIERFSGTFSSIEETIENAQSQFDNHTGEYYEDEESENSHIIHIGKVEHFDVKSAVESYVDDMEDHLFSAIDDFAFGMDWEPEAQILEKDKEEFKDKAINALLPLVKQYVYFSPDMKSSTIQTYDLKERKFVEPQSK